ncbi:glucose-induced degradation protein 4 homolog [Dysidea avara]|uniref:glucose-induced degradation protein 4 homolog n=1 Tax=Dysidea avara TaxID=196820 RepID=UPI00331A93BD
MISDHDITSSERGGVGSQAGYPLMSLHAGGRFTGYQQSRGNKCDVEVILKHVDNDNHYLCGYLKIQGLTDDTFMTFFEGEIISKDHPFLTRKWEADAGVDKDHWGKFSGFKNFASRFNDDSFSYDEVEKSDYIFMRWKELFLVPDHKVADISGTSYAGFYYIAFQKSTSSIEGYYYHKSSEWYQSLFLEYQPGSTVTTYQFH